MKMFFSMVFAAAVALSMSASASSERSQSPPVVRVDTQSLSFEMNTVDVSKTLAFAHGAGETLEKGITIANCTATELDASREPCHDQERFTSVLREDANLYAIMNTRSASESKFGSYEESLDASSSRAAMNTYLGI